MTISTPPAATALSMLAHFPSPPRKKPPANDAATLSQWQLIRMNFARHQLAVWSLHVLVVLYLIALLAEFVAPLVPNHGELDFQYAPPQLPRWNWEYGLHVPVLEQRL